MKSDAMEYHDGSNQDVKKPRRKVRDLVEVMDRKKPAPYLSISASSTAVYPTSYSAIHNNHTYPDLPRAHPYCTPLSNQFDFDPPKIQSASYPDYDGHPPAPDYYKLGPLSYQSGSAPVEPPPSNYQHFYYVGFGSVLPEYRKSYEIDDIRVERELEDQTSSWFGS